jgi:hypothetical protein
LLALLDPARCWPHCFCSCQQARPSVKLLYVTPEQLVKSDSLRGLLQDLRQRQLLARFVIDEVRMVHNNYSFLAMTCWEFGLCPSGSCTC